MIALLQRVADATKAATEEAAKFAKPYSARVWFYISDKVRVYPKAPKCRKAIWGALAEVISTNTAANGPVKVKMAKECTGCKDKCLTCNFLPDELVAESAITSGRTEHEHDRWDQDKHWC